AQRSCDTCSLHDALPICSARSFITSGGLGAMGFALPAAIGVQLANPDKTVVSISGDGGFQMNIQELATVKRLGLPIKMVVVDNKDRKSTRLNSSHVATSY